MLYVRHERAKQLLAEMLKAFKTFAPAVEYKRIELTPQEGTTSQEIHLLYRAMPIMIRIIKKAQEELGKTAS
ncbi:TPA: hypothetical protein HA244_01530 [Candidatus Micrarchaeota archaeon]|nr:hypothetical protein [Candidatus Micrarchaeota archaeon]